MRKYGQSRKCCPKNFYLDIYDHDYFTYHNTSINDYNINDLNTWFHKKEFLFDKLYKDGKFIIHIWISEMYNVGIPYQTISILVKLLMFCIKIYLYIIVVKVQQVYNL